MRPDFVKARLHAAKNAAQMTWPQLAELLEVELHSVKRWLTNRRTPAAATMILVDLVAEGREAWSAELYGRIAKIHKTATRRRRHFRRMHMATIAEHRLGLCGRSDIVACVYCKEEDDGVEG